MHGFDDVTAELFYAVVAYSRDRMQKADIELDGPKSEQELRTAVQRAVGRTITEDGLGGIPAFDLFTDVLAQACLSTDHPRYLSFIPCAPTESSALFDLVVSASCLYGGTWLEGAGAVFAENQALGWLAGLAGLPTTAGGVFVPGGTVGNLSALVAARKRQRDERADDLPRRWAVAGTDHTHSSILSACEVMDADFIGVPVGDDGRLTGEALAAELDARDHDGVFAVVATAGTTNLGIVDDLESVGRVCAERELWFHVDGAYGLAGLAAPGLRPLFAGIERADSFVVDPHKWLFAPFDCCALVYRDRRDGSAAHTQRAGYLDVVTQHGDMNPSDYAIGLTRRARGLPFWFSLAVHGTRAYAAALDRTMEVARYAADAVRAHPYLDLLHEPELSVVTFRRRGWEPQDYAEWSDRLRQEGVAFVVPTTHRGETVTRFCIVNPKTTESDVDAILSTMGMSPNDRREPGEARDAAK